jgi:hypothetical protein
LQNVCVQISYLNLKSNLRKVIDKREISDLYSKVCELFSSHIRQQMDSSSEPSQLDKLVENTLRSYILNHTQLILQIYCESQEALVKKAKEMQNQEIKGEIGPNPYERQLVEVCTLVFKYLSQHLTHGFEKFSQV